MAIADQLALPRVESDVNTPLPCGPAQTPRTQTALIPKLIRMAPRSASSCAGTAHRQAGPRQLVLTAAANSVHSTCPKGR
jgi:hypothetical protein